MPKKRSWGDQSKRTNAACQRHPKTALKVAQSAIGKKITGAEDRGKRLKKGKKPKHGGTDVRFYGHGAKVKVKRGGKKKSLKASIHKGKSPKKRGKG